MTLTQDLLDIFKMMEKVKIECSMFLSMVRNPFENDALYRGIANNSDDFIKKTIRLSGRRPTDTSYKEHNKVNQYFKEKYGSPFRDSLFVTGSLNQADNYGDIHHIFPIGDFKFLWSMAYEDLFSATSEFSMDDAMTDIEYEERFETLEDEVLDTYQTTAFSRAIMSGNEIMIRGRSYYAFKEDVLTYEVSNACNEILSDEWIS